jgi:hypothetical protein
MVRGVSGHVLALPPEEVAATAITYDTLDNHMAFASDIGQAAIPMGMLLAWSVRMGIVSHEFERAHERLVLRLRMEEVTGSELLVAAGGDLTDAMFSLQGRAFMQHYYAHFQDDYRMVFGVEESTMYEIKDSWANYARLAAHLTPLLLGPKSTDTNPMKGLFGRLKTKLWH